MPRDAGLESEKSATRCRLARGLGQWIASETIGNVLMLLSWIFEVCGSALVWMLE